MYNKYYVVDSTQIELSQSKQLAENYPCVSKMVTSTDANIDMISTYVGGPNESDVTSLVSSSNLFTIDVIFLKWAFKVNK